MTDVMPAESAVVAAALPMIDPHRWGVPLRIVALLAELQRRSPDGWARISPRRLARRVHCADRTAYWYLGSPSPKRPDDGRLWRIDRVLVRGQVGAGTRGTAWRVNLRADQWRNVPWLEPDAELRALRMGIDFRVSHRGANDGVAPRSRAAELEALAPRSRAAELDPLAPRSRTAEQGFPRSAVYDRGASRAPLSKPLPSTHDGDEQVSLEQRASLVDAINVKCAPRNKRVDRRSSLPGRLLAVVQHPGFVLADALDLIDRAPDELGPPLLVDRLEGLVAGEQLVAPTVAADRIADMTRRVMVLEDLIAANEADDCPTDHLVAELADARMALATETGERR